MRFRGKKDVNFGLRMRRKGGIREGGEGEEEKGAQMSHNHPFLTLSDPKSTLKEWENGNEMERVRRTVQGFPEGEIRNKSWSPCR